jgi:NAD(P)-dependent dehydrogenase (short-subunit alcohol dehydrogenase family)
MAESPTGRGAGDELAGRSALVTGAGNGVTAPSDQPTPSTAANRDELAGRSALVTGAGNGLGRAIALGLARAGARVILVGRTESKLAETAALLPDPSSARIAACDVSSPASVGTLHSVLNDEQISILINNAGIGGPVKPLTDIEPAEWDEVFSANVRSIYLMCRAFLPQMTARGSGDVINVASVSGKRPLTRRTPYTASKMAVLGLTRTLAFEVGPQGVSVNSLSPGPCRGPRMERNFTLEAAATGTTYAEAEEAFVSRAALRRLVEEDEVAAAVLAMLRMPGLCGADIDLSAGMIAAA